MNPFKKFELWFNLAKKKYPFDHTAFALATTDNKNPSVRMVLCFLLTYIAKRESTFSQIINYPCASIGNQ